MTGVCPVSCSRTFEARVRRSPDSPTEMSMSRTSQRKLWTEKIKQTDDKFVDLQLPHGVRWCCFLVGLSWIILSGIIMGPSWRLTMSGTSTNVLYVVGPALNYETWVAWLINCIVNWLTVSRTRFGSGQLLFTESQACWHRSGIIPSFLILHRINSSSYFK